MIGRSIGNYEITRVLGEGGMGTVYLAVHPKIGKKVAIKALHKHFCQDPEQVERFFHEARAVNEIGHPHIVDVSDFGETDDGIVYLVMELLAGETLKQRLVRERQLSFAATIDIARQIAGALAAAHRRNIVHRDLKPDNVFLVAADPSTGAPEKIKLFDFGVAKLLGDQRSSHKTAAGSVLGTPYYMAPEQLRGGAVDGRTDVYALGVLLFETVTGEVPFHATTLVELMSAVIVEPPRLPSTLRPDLPPELQRLILRCLEKDPAARPRDMGEVAAALEGALGQGTSVAAPPSQLPRTSGPAATPPVAGAHRPVSGLDATMAASGTPSPVAPLGAPVAAPAPKPVATPLATSATMATHGPAVARKAPASAGALAVMRGFWARAEERVGRQRLLPLTVGAGAVLLGAFLMLLLSPEDQAPPSAPKDEPLPVAQLLIESLPRGAVVRRIFDVNPLGRTPVRDAQPVDGRRVEYEIRHAGYAVQRVSWQFTAPGEHATVVHLARTGRAAVASSRTAAPSRTAPSRRSKAQPTERRHRVPVATQPAPKASELSSPHIPPLLPSVRVRRLGRN